MNIRRILAIFALVAVMAAPAGMRAASAQAAPSPEAMTAARDLVALISKDTMRQMATQMIGQVWPSVEASLRAKQPNIAPDQVADLRREYETIFYNYLSNLMSEAPTLYARHFTADELNQLVVFYRSPVGQKSLKVLPQLTVEMFQMIIPRLKELEAQIDAAFAKVLRARGLQP